MLLPLPRRSHWRYRIAHPSSDISLPRNGSRVGLRIDLFEACSAFTRVTACTLALSPICDSLSEGFSHFVTSMTAPVASGWSSCRVGFAPTGNRRLFTAHTLSSHTLASRADCRGPVQWDWCSGGNAVCSRRRARMPPPSRTSSEVLRWQSLHVASRPWVAKTASGSSLRVRCSPAACNQANQSASLILSSHGCQRGSACKSRSSGSTFIDARPASRCRCARSSHSNARSASLWYACACAI